MCPPTGNPCRHRRDIRDGATDLQHRVESSLVEMTHYICANVVQGWPEALT